MKLFKFVIEDNNIINLYLHVINIFRELTISSEYGELE